jgi:hypothetical protein
MVPRRKPLHQAVNPCSGLILGTACLPKRVADRRVNWKHFGSVTAENSFDCTTIGDEVEFEIGSEHLRKKQDHDSKLLRQQQMYATMAYDLNFSRRATDRIRQSLEPREEYNRELKSVTDLIHQQIRAKCKLEYDREMMQSQAASATTTSSQEAELLEKIETAKFQVQAASTMMEKLNASRAKSKLQEEYDALFGGGDATGDGDDEKAGDVYSLFSKATSAEACEERQRKMSLFVRNIPVEFTREDVEAYLHELDPELRVRRIKVIPGGLCFIDCKTQSDADALFRAMQHYNKMAYNVIEVSRTEKRS